MILNGASIFFFISKKLFVVSIKTGINSNSIESTSLFKLFTSIIEGNLNLPVSNFVSKYSLT